jgi:carboxymethylenebutenolidase
VIVIQEWWGLDEEVKEHAKVVSSMGYRVLVPDLYRGKLGVEAEEAHHLMQNLDWPGAVADIAGAAAFLKGQGSAKVATIGFCMGGALALASAIRAPNVIDAALPFYGIPGAQLADPSTCTVPVQGHYGDTDAMAGFSDPAAVTALEEKLKASGCTFEVHRYAKVGHAFMNATEGGKARRSKLGQGEHDQESVDLAWTRVRDFLAKNLA